jgi:arylsulfatase A-like enzyme
MVIARQTRKTMAGSYADAMKQRSMQVLRCALFGALGAMLLSALETALFLYQDSRIHEGVMVDALKVQIMAGILVFPFFAILGILTPIGQLRRNCTFGIGLVLLWMYAVGLAPSHLHQPLNMFAYLALIATALFWFGRLVIQRLSTRKFWISACSLWLLAMASILGQATSNSAVTASTFDLAAQSEAPTNVVIINIDTLRADHLGSYGYSRPTSPVMDEIAANGVRFESAWAQAPWTRPATASLMTGLYPSSHQCSNQNQALSPELPTIASLLHERGYHTAAFSANPQVSPLFGFDHGFDLFWNQGRYSLSQFLSMGKSFIFVRQRLGLHRAIAIFKGNGAGSDAAHQAPNHAGIINQQVFAWLDRLDARQPIFLYVHYIDPHDPYDPLVDMLNDVKPDVGRAHSMIQPSMQDIPYPLFFFPEPEPERLKDALDLYDAEIRYVDHHLGLLLERLREKGVLTDDDYLILTSDHGEEFHEHGQWLHGRSLFEEVLHVPLLITGPNVDAQKVSLPVELIDVLPTLAKWLKIPLAANQVQGKDLSPLLQSDQAALDSFIFAERPSAGRHLYSVRSRDRKLIRLVHEGEDSWLLYDLGKDPGETQNLLRRPDYTASAPESSAQAQAKSLHQALSKFIQSATSHQRGPARQALVDSQTQNMLDQLGYLDPTAEVGR